MWRYLIPVLFLVGCGGGGVPNPNAGHYVGTWSAPDNGGVRPGTDDITIAPDGSVTGEHDELAQGVPWAFGTVTGHVDSAGNVNWQVHYTTGAGPMEAVITGTIVVNGNSANGTLFEDRLPAGNPLVESISWTR